MANQQAREEIKSCCSNIEQADSKDDIQVQPQEIRNRLDHLEKGEADQVKGCCQRIEDADSNEEIQQETDKIKSCCG